MLKKITVGVSALAMMGFAGSAMAQTNPWAPGQTTVPITVTVQPMVELFTNTANVPLNIVDAGENQGSTNAVQRTLHHIHNVGVTVSAEIDNDIANDTQFHILVNPSASWGSLATSGADRVISWRREGGIYSGATGGHPNQVSGTGTGDQVMAFTAASNAGGAGTTTKPIQYFADSRNVMADQGVTNFNVVWTIAP